MTYIIRCDHIITVINAIYWIEYLSCCLISLGFTPFYDYFGGIYNGIIFFYNDIQIILLFKKRKHEGLIQSLYIDHREKAIKYFR